MRCCVCGLTPCFDFLFLLVFGSRCWTDHLIPHVPWILSASVQYVCPLWSLSLFCCPVSFLLLPPSSPCPSHPIPSSVIFCSTQRNLSICISAPTTHPHALHSFRFSVRRAYHHPLYISSVRQSMALPSITNPMQLKSGSEQSDLIKKGWSEIIYHSIGNRGIGSGRRSKSPSI